MVLGVYLSIRLTGRGYDHYYSQYFCVASLLLGTCFGVVRDWRKVVAPVCMVVWLGFLAYYDLIPRLKREHHEYLYWKTLPFEKMYPPYPEIVKLLKDEGSEGEYMLTCSRLEFVFYSGAKWPARYVLGHPPYMLEMSGSPGYDVLKEGMLKNPKFIVDTPGNGCFKKLQSYLDADYTNIFSNSDLVIYKRREPEAGATGQVE